MNLLEVSLPSKHGPRSTHPPGRVYTHTKVQSCTAKSICSALYTYQMCMYNIDYVHTYIICSCFLVYVSIYLSIDRSIYRSIHPSICLCIYFLHVPSYKHHLLKQFYHLPSVSLVPRKLVSLFSTFAKVQRCCFTFGSRES